MRKYRRLELMEWSIVLAFMAVIVTAELKRQLLPSEEKLRLEAEVDALRDQRDSLQIECYQLQNENRMICTNNEYFEEWKK